MITGITIRTAMPAWLRRRPTISRISESSNRPKAAGVRLPLSWSGAAGAICCGSATDIEPGSGQGDELVLEARPPHQELRHRHVGTDQ